MKIAVVVLNFRTPNDVVKCISSIKDTSKNIGSVYLVDNNSADNSLEVFAKEYSNDSLVTIIASNDNKGYSYGNNLGLKAAYNDGYKYVLIVNPDVIFHANAIDCMLDELSKNDSIAVVGPKVLSATGTVMKYCKKGIDLRYYLYVRKPLKYFDFKHYAANYHMNYDGNNNSFFDGMVSGCCFMAKLDILHEVGYFDDKIFLYYEEDTLWSKFSQKGYLSEIVANAEITHFHSVSIGGTTSPFSRMWEEISAIYYLKNYRNLNGIKLKFAVLYSKLFFLLVNIKNKQGFKYFKELRSNLQRINKNEI